MAAHNSSRFDTAFCVSLKAREGTTTGISAADRAATILAAINPATRAAHLTRPGHVFPLRAKSAGVLARAGQTEAAVDLARLTTKRNSDTAHFGNSVRLRRSHGSDFPTVINIFVSAIQEYIEIRSHLFMISKIPPPKLRRLSERVDRASATRTISETITRLFSAT